LSNASYWQQLNKRVIAEFRANGGVLKTRKWPVILLTTTGAKSGREHVTPLNFTRDRNDLVVIASKGGSATHPDWYLNLVANPEVEIEDGPDKFKARATVAREPRRTRLFDAQASEMTFFDGYRKKVKTREIPVVVFERIAKGSGE
jgi:deazaflavin-dependent oxidoreductase (nitroreductase family)